MEPGDVKSVRPIITLPDDVVKKIAAGEVVVRPLNAVKELIENSMDAGATEITVACKNGGLDLIRVKDNGCGISIGDYECVCERFATSKLKTAADLQQISTFGFRGEALASISCMAKVSVTSRTKDASYAWTASYKNCKPASKATPSAGLLGTQIVAENLFQDYPQRRSVFNRPNEESIGIVNVLTKYAINFPHIKFAFVKDDGAKRSSGSFCSPGNGDQHAVIRLLMPSNLTKDLFDFEVSSVRYKFSAKICMANPLSSHTSTAIKARNDKQKIFQLFINNRLVSSDKLKKTIDEAFKTHDAYCPFMNISMQIEPSRIDVNVHPTKEVVCFLDEAQIIDCIETKLFEILENFRHKGIIKLSGVNCGSFVERETNTPQSSVINKQQEPSTSVELSPIKGNSSSFDFGYKRKFEMSNNSDYSVNKAKMARSTNNGDTNSRYKFDMAHAFAKIYAQPNATVRVDASNHSIQEYITPNTTLQDISYQSLEPGEISVYSEVTHESLFDTTTRSDCDQNLGPENLSPRNDIINQTVGELPDDRGKYVFKAMAEIQTESNDYLTGIVRKFVFIGFVDVTHATFQSENSLFLVELMPLLEEFFYQRCLGSVGRQHGRRIILSTTEFPNGIPLVSLVETYLSICPNVQLPNEHELDSKEEAVENLVSKFCQPQIPKLLWDFGISVESDDQHGPLLNAIVAQVDGYDLLLSQQLAQFAYELACINWANMELVGKEIARAVAHLHTPHQLAHCSESTAKNQCEMIKNRLVNLLKVDFLVPGRLNPHFTKLLSTFDAYKIFGRC